LATEHLAIVVAAAVELEKSGTATAKAQDMTATQAIATPEANRSLKGAVGFITQLRQSDVRGILQR
jgi:hypothetical protein